MKINISSQTLSVFLDFFFQWDFQQHVEHCRKKQLQSNYDCKNMMLIKIHRYTIVRWTLFPKPNPLKYWGNFDAQCARFRIMQRELWAFASVAKSEWNATMRKVAMEMSETIVSSTMRGAVDEKTHASNVSHCFRLKGGWESKRRKRETLSLSCFEDAILHEQDNQTEMMNLTVSDFQLNISKNKKRNLKARWK